MTSAEQAQKKSIVMTRHYPDVISAFVWLKQISLPARIIRSATQIWVVTHHLYGISGLVYFLDVILRGNQWCRNVGRFLWLLVYFYSRHLMEPTRVVFQHL